MDQTQPVTSNKVTQGYLLRAYLILVIFSGILILSALSYVVYIKAFSQTTNKQNTKNLIQTVTVTATNIINSITPSPTLDISPTITNTINLAAIPLGDNHVSTYPQKGYIDSCQTSFNGLGAKNTGNWVNGNTWNEEIKPAVEGKNTWPNAQYSVTINGDNRILIGNGLPVGSYTGNFPIEPSDPAYQYDRNPSSVTAQNINFTIPVNPTLAANPTCVPMGIIGVAENGVAIFNGLDAVGRDAVAHEIQDQCDGHPEKDGEYHYHGPSSCIKDEYKPNTLIGYALDGFGIYSMYDANGKEYTNNDLDECHGITSPENWDGKVVNIYHYVLTNEYPYTVGCFRGTPVRSTQPGQMQKMQAQP